jgi:DNA-binding CsgD family transcriptional regulator
VITVDINDRKIFEQELEASRDELERRVASRTAELAAANEELRLEREMLRQKNIALQEVLAQIEDGKRTMAAQIQANITRIAIPIVESMARRSDASSAHLVKLLRECLGNISAPLVSKLDSQPLSLSPRELQICHMIRSGLSSKQIAAAFDTSVLTVNKQRNQIRKKLGIAKKKVNLVSLLGRLERPTE